MRPSAVSDFAALASLSAHSKLFGRAVECVRESDDPCCCLLPLLLLLLLLPLKVADVKMLDWCRLRGQQPGYLGSRRSGSCLAAEGRGQTAGGP